MNWRLPVNKSTEHAQVHQRIITGAMRSVAARGETQRETGPTGQQDGPLPACEPSYLSHCDQRQSTKPHAEEFRASIRSHDATGTAGLPRVTVMLPGQLQAATIR